MNKISFLTLLVLFIPFNVSAGALSNIYEYLSSYDTAITVENPNQMQYSVTTEKSCAFDENNLNDIVEGVLVRSRIKPLKFDSSIENRIFLRLQMNCLHLSSGQIAYAIQANYARWKPFPVVIYEVDYGVLGVGNKNSIINGLKSSVENAVTAFVKVNFDLK